MKTIEVPNKIIILGSDFGSKVIHSFVAAFFGVFLTKDPSGNSVFDWILYLSCFVLSAGWLFIIWFEMKRKMTITNSTIEVQWVRKHLVFREEPLQISIEKKKYPGWQVSIQGIDNKQRLCLYHFARKKRANEFVDLIKQRYAFAIQISSEKY